MSVCGTEKSAYDKCMHSSGRNAGACSKFATELKRCGDSVGKDFCIAESEALMKCSKAPGSDACAKEFMLMRECNRPSGKHMQFSDGVFSVPSDKAGLFNGQKIGLVSVAAPPTRTTAAMQAAGNDIAVGLHIPGGKADVRF
uniref:CHCH domain-containing protein n=1 Tax=Oxyrrhis marina TaxID=2969 RepID=A0A7S3UP71_OXYMA